MQIANVEIRKLRRRGQANADINCASRKSTLNELHTAIALQLAACQTRSRLQQPDTDPAEATITS